MRNAKIETLCFNARAQQYILQISRFSHFLIYALPKSKAILENSFDLFTLFHGESK